MARAKKTRKELLKEPDEFITLTGKLIRWGTAHQTHLLGGLLALVVVALGVSAYRFFDARAEAKAAELLRQAVSRYEAQRAADKPPLAAFEAVAGDFEKLLDQYGGKQNGRLAQLTFANLAYEAGKYETAARLYERCLETFEDFPVLRSRVLLDLALAQIQLGRYPQAVDHLKRIADGTGTAYRDEALFHLGALYAKTGEKDKSRAAFDRLQADFADSLYRELVAPAADG